MKLERLRQSFEELARFSDEGEGINRLAYTEAERNARNYLIRQFELAGLTVRTDYAGNVIARREGKSPDLPVVATGSHIDSVYAAGEFDGTAGILVALEVMRSLTDEHVETEHPLEAIIFACEESARFGASTLGSKAMTGRLDPAYTRSLTDRNGVTLFQAFQENGLDLEEVHLAKRFRDEIKSFVELHVEQGPVLEKQEAAIGVVSAIAAPIRFHVHIDGTADHSGTTPMDYRHDALLGGAEIALSVEKAALEELEHGTVGTVGVFSIQPGAMNVVPGTADLYVDIRGTNRESRMRVVDTLKTSVTEVAKTRGLDIWMDELSSEEPVQMDKILVAELKSICEKKGVTWLEMPSGAGHDSMNMAALCPTGMIFVPSKDGLSHNPAEYTSMEQLMEGAEVLRAFMLKQAKVL
ncbi:M20 family metallo-hydrolase [Sporosarcina highlanderae]|uniref:M20 family metallo-hydrolase n=1 Tax=Sporosarcina highlanderae TaxID=3035916 RepID=A0ABT8JTZ0_9BACL|nr:M20 family metallo-hydrolase [Sporosarcina highlanderae]MDN4608457.1 M20 family metallo-hydrolase [Sporosarcina highlanderae]